MEKKWVYLFKEGEASKKALLGGKGANLAEMTNIGLPVPYGFTVTTEACAEFYNQGEKLSDEIKAQVDECMKVIEEQSGKKFGDINDPLLVSVRSGAAISMPGMMDTILNLGLNDDSVIGLATKTENERFAYDSYRRFIQMFSDVVLSVPKYLFENVLDDAKEENGYESDTELTTEDLKKIVDEYKAIYKKEVRKAFPQDPKEQLEMAINAVFSSWNNARAITYRNIHNLSHSMGTAVNVQSMVFGNMGDDSGTGVAFSRNPATGENKLFGEFLMNAQGEDVVAGIRTPKTIDELGDIMPEVYAQFKEITENLEKHYKDMQDIEFTIEKGKLFILQTRNGKRTADAALRAAVEMVGEGLITKNEALLRIEPSSLDQLLHPTFDETTMVEAEALTKGLPASPGAASGKVYFTAHEAVAAVGKGEAVILVRKETSPEDIEGMNVANGILTARGGMTSHAAVVARGMGKCCVAGCDEVRVNEEAKEFTIKGEKFVEGDTISLDGSTGKVYKGSIKTVEPNLSGNFAQLMEWADETRTLKVRTNADTPVDSETAVRFGAEGIGLCRTEHMFFDEERIPEVRKMILSETVEQRKEALEKILPMQKADFKGIYKVMKERPVTVRLLDPPLHEFLPQEEADIKALSDDMNVSIEKMKEVINSLHEFNPMLGHRGCRLAITYPEIAVMQTRAIIEAAIEVNAEEGVCIKPEIMIPLAGMKTELEYLKGIVENTVEDVIAEKDGKLEYLVGTMIEIPRAAVTADEIAEVSEFFSFGTNDLTQMGFGFSRDDAGKFIGEYIDKEILPRDPFQSIDQAGIGKLVEIGVNLGRKTRNDLKIGVCGEHGGDPESIDFFYRAGLDYVSCSPYRVPIARLAAAQAVLNNK
ncbi:pyruvate phosphate dikinase [Dethiosulfatibacter aminovorans DSM 17477]|uniref:Pyruvate, phosphate dikinase n=1 Tax=Dethiosulfatibacter aminovorans DSM 17477 TaxID=1121476 RepID=A0A1M6K112_9FIRM|nr:pyruvate, phosphate dikinase [Dethiosulfatibacter aminovorans]SHJ52617.1 pyruvate phosphate dikinase [Dethiosulfatibacter aminovorans DSM 17477]